MNEEVITNLNRLIGCFDITTFITSIASIVLAVVSVVLSILFYCLGQKVNSETTKLTQDIQKNTQLLNSLFDEMFRTSFRLIEQQSNAMQNKLFDTVGSVGNNEVRNLELEVLSEIREQGECTVESLKANLEIDKEKIQSIVDNLQKIKFVTIDNKKIKFAMEQKKFDSSLSI